MSELWCFHKGRRRTTNQRGKRDNRKIEELFQGILKSREKRKIERIL